MTCGARHNAAKQSLFKMSEVFIVTILKQRNAQSSARLSSYFTMGSSDSLEGGAERGRLLSSRAEEWWRV